MARYVTVRYGLTRMDQHYITISYVTLRYVRVENTHKAGNGLIISRML